jgi:hypothetical protein
MHMDESKPPIPSSEFHFKPSVAVYWRTDEEVREGFLVALNAMGVADVEQRPEPKEPPVRSAKP